MEPFVTIALAAWLAGIAAFVGGVLASLEGTAETEVKQGIVHAMVAFGGGILVAAVAFALAPEGLANLSPPVLAGTFLAGGLFFCGLDIVISRNGGSKAQLMAMLLDFVPEAMALGALFGHSDKAGLLLALFIGAQNLPEGFNSHRENVSAGTRARTSLLALLAVSVLGPLAAGAGYLFLREQPALTASIMSFAAGGILYLVFQDIAPQARMRRHWTPPLGAVVGFVLGMVGKQMLG